MKATTTKLTGSDYQVEVGTARRNDFIAALNEVEKVRPINPEAVPVIERALSEITEASWWSAQTGSVNEVLAAAQTELLHIANRSKSVKLNRAAYNKAHANDICPVCGCAYWDAECSHRPSSCYGR